MKRLLSLILALLFCLNFIVSCEKEEAPSSSSSEESSSNNQKENQNKMIENPYISYRLSSVSAGFLSALADEETGEMPKHQGRVFVAYQGFADFLNECKPDLQGRYEPDEITPSDFEGYIVYALLIKDNGDIPLNYGKISNSVSKKSGSAKNDYVLLAERDIVDISTTDEAEYKMDFVLIPRGELGIEAGESQAVSQAYNVVGDIDLLYYSHLYITDQETINFDKSVLHYVECSSTNYDDKTYEITNPPSFANEYYSAPISSENHRYMVIHDYESFKNSISGSDEFPSITEETFTDNFVIIVYHFADLREKAGRYYEFNYRINDLENIEDIDFYLYINYQKTNRVFDDNVTQPCLDVVVIPKSSCCGYDPREIEIKLYWGAKKSNTTYYSPFR